jgi:outer membrane protein OmpA-like peptidoglycan-associated protein
MRDPALRGEIQGHTDNIGSAVYNQGLSERRAKAVRDYLLDLGIDSSRLDAVGFGLDRPAVSNETEIGRARNRRIEFRRID